MSTAPPSRPAYDFYQTPAVISKAGEILMLSVLDQLVRKKVLTAAEAFSTFSSLHVLSSGVNNAHQVGMTLRLWRDTFKWMLERDTEERARSSTA